MNSFHIFKAIRMRHGYTQDKKFYLWTWCGLVIVHPCKQKISKKANRNFITTHVQIILCLMKIRSKVKPQTYHKSNLREIVYLVTYGPNNSWNSIVYEAFRAKWSFRLYKLNTKHLISRINQSSFIKYFPDQNILWTFY